MAVYFNNQPQDKSFLGSFGEGLQPALQYMMQNGLMDKRAGINREANIQNNALRQDNINLQNDNAINRMDNQRDYKQGILDRTYGANAQVPIAEGQPQIPIAGQMNPANTGLTQQMLNQMKMEAQTGVTAPKQQKQAQPQFAYKGGNVLKDGVNTGETYPLTPSEMNAGGAGSMSNLGKTFNEMGKWPKDSPQYKAYTAYVDYQASGRISPELQVLFKAMGINDGATSGNQIQQPTGNSFGFLPQEGNTPKAPKPSVLDFYKD